MDSEIMVLMLTAAALGSIHTILGPDHYLPFVMMSRAQGWSRLKTAGVTAICGLGHVASSIILGALGIGLGLTITRLEALESARGSIAGWALIGFGLMYLVWGVRRAVRNRPHTHWHRHADGDVHKHPHGHTAEHSHVHESSEGGTMTPWILFTLFVFGPCEALIPMLMYPAAKSSVIGIVCVSGVFGLATLVTMLIAVMTLSWGAQHLSLGRFERYTHAVAGGTICLSGIAVQLLGL